jgi:hypothetical protein
MTDSVMSGWGMAKDKINKLVFICDNLTEAQVVAANARNRGDQKYINICTNKPKYFIPTKGIDYNYMHYYVQIKTKDTYPTWYKPGAF